MIEARALFVKISCNEGEEVEQDYNRGKITLSICGKGGFKKRLLD